MVCSEDGWMTEQRGASGSFLLRTTSPPKRTKTAPKYHSSLPSSSPAHDPCMILMYAESRVRLEIGSRHFPYYKNFALRRRASPAAKHVLFWATQCWV